MSTGAECQPNGQVLPEDPGTEKKDNGHKNSRPHTYPKKSLGALHMWEKFTKVMTTTLTNADPVVKTKLSVSHLSDERTFKEFVDTNPLLNTQKDRYGRRYGVSERNHWDSIILTEILKPKCFEEIKQIRSDKESDV